MSNEPFKYQKETIDFIWQNILKEKDDPDFEALHWDTFLGIDE